MDVINMSTSIVEDLPGEVWKDVPGYEGLYQISNMERVKSLKRGALIKVDKAHSATLSSSGKKCEKIHVKYLVPRLFSKSELMFEYGITDLPGEVWKDVPGYEGLYVASNMCRVKSLGRFIKNPRGYRYQEEFLPKGVLFTSNVGYDYTYNLRKDGKVTNYYMANIIYSLFIGKIPDGCHATATLNKSYTLQNIKLIKYGEGQVKGVDRFLLGVGDLYRGCKITRVIKEYKEERKERYGWLLELECSKCGDTFSQVYHKCKMASAALCPRCTFNKRHNTKYKIGDSVEGHQVVEITYGGSDTVYTLKCKYCGNIFKTKLHNLVMLKIPSCGCQNLTKAADIPEELKDQGITSDHTLYRKWHAMRRRCYQIEPTIRAYNEYRGKKTAYSGNGIGVCELWRNSFREFYTWSIANGWRSEKIEVRTVDKRTGETKISHHELLHLDRIDPDGDYAPYNCQWLTRNENSKKVYDDKKRKDNPVTARIMKRDYFRRQKKWIKEMEKKGYKKEDIL